MTKQYQKTKYCLKNARRNGDCKSLVDDPTAQRVSPARIVTAKSDVHLMSKKQISDLAFTPEITGTHGRLGLLFIKPSEPVGNEPKSRSFIKKNLSERPRACFSALLSYGCQSTVHGSVNASYQHGPCRRSEHGQRRRSYRRWDVRCIAEGLGLRRRLRCIGGRTGFRGLGGR